MAGFFTGTPGKERRLQRFDPQRQAGFDQVLQQALSGLQQGAGDFGPIAKQAEERYFGDILPSIAERFTSMGGQRSSGFQEARERSGTELSTNLAALQSQHGLQQQGLLQNLLGMGLTQQEDVGWIPRDPGFFRAMAPGVGQGVGRWIGGGGGEGGGMDSEKITKLISLLSRLLG